MSSLRLSLLRLTNKGRKMKVVDFVLLICVTSIAVSSVLLAYRPSDELNRLQEEKTAIEIKILQHELAAYEAMEKELKSER